MIGLWSKKSERSTSIKDRCLPFDRFCGREKSGDGGDREGPGKGIHYLNGACHPRSTALAASCLSTPLDTDEQIVQHGCLSGDSECSVISP
ncbi:hypothetical protein AB1N83_008371 [Pleurotus pulmonarius]